MFICQQKPLTSCFMWFFLLLFYSAFVFPQENFQSINDIVSKLNPLDVVANHGGVRYSVDLDIRFDFGSAKISTAAKNQVEALAGALHSPRLDDYQIEIIGHTDTVGSADANQRLSALRADAVKNRLVKKYGIDPARLRAIGKGESALIKGIDGEDSRNRRVQIVAKPISVEGSMGSEPAAVATDSAVDNSAEDEQSINW